MGMVNGYCFGKEIKQCSELFFPKNKHFPLLFNPTGGGRL